MPKRSALVDQPAQLDTNHGNMRHQWILDLFFERQIFVRKNHRGTRKQATNQDGKATHMIERKR
jgi:hypothetical protein